MSMTHSSEKNKIINWGKVTFSSLKLQYKSAVSLHVTFSIVVWSLQVGYYWHPSVNTGKPRVISKEEHFKVQIKEPFTEENSIYDIGQD